MAASSKFASGYYGRKALRILFVTHRDLGIAVSALMVIWCLSGVVLMYVWYPSIPEGRRLAALEPLRLQHCCMADGQNSAIAASTPVSAARVEMLAGVPVADVETAVGARELVDLRSGESIKAVSAEQAGIVASEFARHSGLPARAPQAQRVAWDQWVTSEEFDKNRPYYKYSYHDPERSQLYVSAVSGQAMQFTTERLRFWNWLGAVPHWVYFEPLRRHEFYWLQVIILTSAVGSFLTITGIYIGVRQYLRRPARRTSPYRGYMFWHHIPGLVFGAFLLMWVVSGLFSVAPYGFLAGGDIGADQRRLAGSPPTWGELLASLQQISRKPETEGLVSLQTAPLGGRLFFIGTSGAGIKVRMDATGGSANLTAADLALEAHLLGGAAASVPELMGHSDEYYYRFEGFPETPSTLPVYRLVLDDADHTRYYLDPLSGAVIAKFDAGARGYRWFHFGPHRMDFTPFLRSRPFWDIVTLILLLGSTVIAATGLYSAVLRMTGRHRLSRGRKAPGTVAPNPQQRLS